jgi:hypothetical protein
MIQEWTIRTHTKFRRNNDTNINVGNTNSIIKSIHLLLYLIVISKSL